MSRAVDQRCSAWLAAQGKAYPRTCQVHGLRGCPKVVGENTKAREPDVPRSEVEGWRLLSPDSMPVEGELAVFKSTAHGLVTGRVVYSDSMFARVPKGVAGKALDTDATFFRDVTHWLRLPDARPVVFAESVPRDQANWEPDASTPRVLCPLCGGSGHARDGAGRVLGDCARCSGTGAVDALHRETIPAPLPAWADDGDLL